MSNIEIVPAQTDLRPAFALSDVHAADFFRIKTPHVADVPTFTLTNVSDLSVARSRPIPDVEVTQTADRQI